MRFTSLASVNKFLDHIPKFQSEGASAANFDLSRFKQFCDSMGNPHHDFPAIHVAGTNGKGSTCKILGNVLTEAGYKTGIYTSPHINQFSERFQIDGDNISEQALVAFFNRYSAKLKEYKLTYFEISTAIAFWWFAEQNIDLGVIEVGLGGRLDATNIIDPLVSVITSISLDHTDILGETLEEIAREKGGIIKEERPVVTGELPAKAESTIRTIAREKNSNICGIDKLNPRCLQAGVYEFVDEDTKIRLYPRFSAPVQSKNIAIAWQVVQQIREQFTVSTEQFIKGVEQADIGLGRFEKLCDSRPWYFDGAHNLEAVKALKDSIKKINNDKEVVLILSLMKDKLRPQVMKEFLDYKNIYYYQLNLERAASFDDIKQWLPQVISFPDDRYQQFLAKDLDSKLVIFAGSFYFYTTVRDWVKNLSNC